MLLLVTLVVLQVGGSFLDPDYYPKELRKANVYEFALGDLLTSALDEARQVEGEDLPQGLDENPLTTSGLSTADIVTSVNTAIPPEWVQSIVEQVFEELGRYLAGEGDEFQVTIRAGDRVGPMVAEVKSLLRQADAYNLLFEEIVTPNATDAVVDDLPLGLTLDGEDVVSSVRKVVDPEWVRLQVESTLDELTPYVEGSRDTFEITIQLSDRVEIALAEVKSLLRKANAYDLLYDEVVEPRVLDFLGPAVDLPLGISITNDEVLAALRQVAPPEFVQQQAEAVIDQAGPYLTGTAESFNVTIPLADNKRQARDAILETAQVKVEEAAAALPACDVAALRQLTAQPGLSAIPKCIPPGVEPAEVVGRLGEDLAAEVDSLVLDAIPDEIAFSDADLRKALADSGAGENLDLIDDVRRIVSEGWSYTDTDLREDLRQEVDEEAVERLDDARAFLKDGWTYTEIDFRSDVERAGPDRVLEDLDRFRDNLGRARTLRLLIFLPALLLLVVIGFLGGRSWRGRLGWSAAYLAATAGIIFVLFGSVYSVVGKPQLDDAREEAISEIDLTGDFEETARLAIDKAFDIAESMVNGIASGIATKGFLLLILGGVVLAASIFWHELLSLTGRDKPGPEGEQHMEGST